MAALRSLELRRGTRLRLEHRTFSEDETEAGIDSCLALWASAANEPIAGGG